MRSLLFVPAAALAIFTGTLGADAATVTREVFTFDATLTSGTSFCGEYVSLESACPEKFGSFSGWQADDLMHGLALSDTVSGKIILTSSDGLLESASCSLGGRDCLFSTELFFGGLPVGPAGVVDFTWSSVVGSRFDFGAGTYFFGTDYTFDEDGVHYYSGVRFSLENVEHRLVEVPLPASAGFLLAGLLGFGIVRRLKRPSA